MELSITNEKIKESSCPAEIFYNGVGCKFRNFFSEREFRDIIKKNKKYIDSMKFEPTYYNHFKEAINNPLECNLDLLIEFTGAIKLN